MPSNAENWKSSQKTRKGSWGKARMLVSGSSPRAPSVRADILLRDPLRGPEVVPTSLWPKQGGPALDARPPHPRHPRPGSSSESSSLCGCHPEEQETPTPASCSADLHVLTADTQQARQEVLSVYTSPPNWGRPGPNFRILSSLRALEGKTVGKQCSGRTGLALPPPSQNGGGICGCLIGRRLWVP